MRISRVLAVILIITLAGGCLEYTITTKVNKDGSIERQYTVSGDSASIFKGTLMVPRGSQWKISEGFADQNKQKDASDKQYIYTASKKFRNAKALSEWLASDTSSYTIKLRVNLKKRCHWFYTHYDYSETYPMIFPFRGIPVDSFLTEIEQYFIIDDGSVVYSSVERKLVWKKDTARILYSHADSLETNKIHEDCETRVQQWMVESFLKDFNQTLSDSFGDDPDISMIRKGIESNKEVFYRKLQFFTNDSALNTAYVAKIYDSLTGTKTLTDLYKKNPAAFREIDRKIDGLVHMDLSDNYEHYLEMPGKLYSTNATTQDSIGLHWKIENDMYVIKDYVMTASSRTPNYLFMVFTGLIAITLVYVLIPKRKPKNLIT
jgi:hypothetical protein